jgi:hypothetical protein
MTDERDDLSRDRQLLAAIGRGPGHYPTPSPERVNRLIEQGLVKKARGNLRLTLKGYLARWFSR